MSNDDILDTNKVLSNFLRQLASNIDDEKLSPSQLQTIGEFYMNFLFQNEGEENCNELLVDDWKKFVTLGWYIYTHIIPENQEI